MRVYISADIEGCTGLSAWSQCGGNNNDASDFEFARRMMTHDVNAAIRGARLGGATEILVKDSHGNSKSLLVDELEDGVDLISGRGAGENEMMEGVDGGFDCAMLIGYHAMAGTARAVMEHTLCDSVHRMWVGDVEAGEIGLCLGTAGALGVPVVCVTGDTAACHEASRLAPAVKTASVKTGLGRYMAKMTHPSKTARLIESAAREGVRSAAKVEKFCWPEPTRIRVELSRTEEADAAETYSGVQRVNGYTLEWVEDTFLAAFRKAIKVLELAETGGESNE